MTTKNHKQQKRVARAKQPDQSTPEEKSLQSKAYKVLVGFAIVAIVYYYAIQPETIGHDVRFIVYIFLLPTVIGIIALGYYRREFLLKQWKTDKSAGEHIISVIFDIAQ